VLPVLLGLAAVGLLLGAAGCGGDSVAAGATVRVYVGADLCAEAQGELAKTGGKAGDLELEAVCLKPVESGSRLNLATIGANARGATEDSSAIAYVEAQGPANRFAQSIVEEAGIAYVTASSGDHAVRQVLDAVEAAGSGSLRDQVRQALERSS
jgi:hypothetical protein